MDKQTESVRTLTLEGFLIILVCAARDADMPVLEIVRIERAVKALVAEHARHPIPHVWFDGDFSPPLERALSDLLASVFSMVDERGHTLRARDDLTTESILSPYSEHYRRVIANTAARFVELLRGTHL